MNESQVWKEAGSRVHCLNEHLLWSLLSLHRSLLPAAYSPWSQIAALSFWPLIPSWCVVNAQLLGTPSMRWVRQEKKALTSRGRGLLRGFLELYWITENCSGYNCCPKIQHTSEFTAKLKQEFTVTASTFLYLLFIFNNPKIYLLQTP